MSKPEINIPAEFAPDGTKTPFSSSKVQYGFDRLNPDILAGDNLNQFIDDTYKGLNGVLELYDEKVNKSGDTMTGNLNIRKESHPAIEMSISNLIKGTNPSEMQYMGITFNDKNSDSASHYSNTRLGLIEFQSLTDGTERIVIAPYRNVANSTEDAKFAISIPQSGSGYCFFPNTTCCDGLFVNKATQIMNSVSLNGSSNLTYTLSDLPTDGNYLVWLSANVTTGSSSGNRVALEIYSDVISDHIKICDARTRAATTVGASGSIVIPVSSSRKIYVKRNTDFVGTASLWLKGYRRIGTNA